MEFRGPRKNEWFISTGNEPAPLYCTAPLNSYRIILEKIETKRPMNRREILFVLSKEHIVICNITKDMSFGILNTLKILQLILLTLTMRQLMLMAKSLTLNLLK